MNAQFQAPSHPNNLGSERRWTASLDLGFVARQDTTYLKEMRFEGPLRVQRPFYPEGGICHQYILHPPGGIVSGDQVGVKVRAHPHSKVLLTTPSAGKFYHSDSCDLQQVQTNRLDLESQSQCEWLPQETIVFNGANAVNRLDVHATSSSQLIAWDIAVLGRRYGDEPFETGSFRQYTHVSVDERLLWVDRFHTDAGSKMMRSVSGLAGHLAMGTLLFLCDQQETLVPKIKSLGAAETKRLSFGVTSKGRLTILRVMACTVEPIKEFFLSCWRETRPIVLDLEPCAPRIWNT